MKIERNLFLFKADYFLAYLWPLSILAIVYFEQVLGSYAAALGVFSISNIAQGICVIPSGILSDKIGRKPVLILSNLFLTVAFSAFAAAGSWQSPGLLLAGGICWGVSSAIGINSREALMYETSIQINKKYDIVCAQSQLFSQIGSVVGSLISLIVAYFYSLNVLAWLSVAFALIQLCASCAFVEPAPRSHRDEKILKHLRSMCNDFVSNKRLRRIALLQIINKNVGRTMFRMESMYFNTLIPTFLINGVMMLRQGIGAIGFMLVPLMQKIGFVKMILAATASNAFFGILGLAFNNVLSPFIIAFQNILYGAEVTAESALLQKELSSLKRTSMHACISVVGCFFSAIVNYLFGTLADFTSVYVAMIFLIACKAFIGVGYRVCLKNV